MNKRCLEKIELYNSSMSIKSQEDYFLSNMYNGVGSRSFFINPPDFIFGPAAKIHDFLYFVGGTEEDRKASDEIYNLYAKNIISQKHGVKRHLYSAIHTVYYFVLKMLGKYAFEYYPEPAKTWDEVVDRYKSYLARSKRLK